MNSEKISNWVEQSWILLMFDTQIQSYIETLGSEIFIDLRKNEKWKNSCTNARGS